MRRVVSCDKCIVVAGMPLLDGEEQKTAVGVS